MSKSSYARQKDQKLNDYKRIDTSAIKKLFSSAVMEEFLYPSPSKWLG